MFQLILPFQLDLPFESGGVATARAARASAGPSRTPRSKVGSRARRERLGSASLELPCFLLGAAASEQVLDAASEQVLDINARAPAGGHRSDV